MTQHFHLLLMTAAFCLVACSADDEQEPRVNRYPLTVKVSERPPIDPEAPANEQATRSAITTTSTLTSFAIDYQYPSYDELSHGSTKAEKKNDGRWWLADSWPLTAAENDSEVSWYAYTAGTFIPGDKPYISFTVDENAGTQKDLLVAKTSGKYSTSDGAIYFTFDHVCTALRIKVKKYANLADYTLRISNVRLYNVIKTGQYDYATESWTLGSKRSYYTLYDGSPKLIDTGDYVDLDSSDEPYLFMIPQKLMGWDTSKAISSVTDNGYIQITCTLTNNSGNVFDGKAYIPFSANFKPGYLHDVKINIGKNSLYKEPNTRIIP